MKPKYSWFLQGLLVLALVAAIAPAAMATSNTVSYQGTLRDATLNPVADGNYPMVFSIWDDATAGTKRWGDESHPAVPTVNGMFSVYLGSGQPLGNLFAQYGALWLEISANTGTGMQTYAPRVPLASVPYAQYAPQAGNAQTAVNAGNAGTLEGQDVDDILAAVDSRINAALTKIVPVGTIVGWHKSLSGVPALPGTWVECNGGTVNDPQSPLNNQAIPSLNGSGRFLRGAAASGTFQGDQMQGHIHTTSSERPDIYLGTYQPEPNQGWWAGYPGGQRGGLAQWTQAGGGLQSIYRQLAHSHTVSQPTNDGTNGNPRFGSETRPTNMSVVWIMRIK